MIREMQKADWNRVSEIYQQALLAGKSTFNTVCPDYDEWDNNHIKDCRYVAEIDDMVVGWIAISPTSSRKAYKGVVCMWQFFPLTDPVSNFIKNVDFEKLDIGNESQRIDLENGKTPY